MVFREENEVEERFDLGERWRTRADVFWGLKKRALRRG
jgi:hypothetical protein